MLFLKVRDKLVFIKLLSLQNIIKSVKCEMIDIEEQTFQ